MKINEITEAVSAMTALKNQMWQDFTPAGRLGLNKASKDLPAKYPTTPTPSTSATRNVASTTVNANPGELAVVVSGTRKFFYNPSNGKWWEHFGSNWPTDYNVSQPVSADADAFIDNAVATGNYQVIKTPKVTSAGSAGSPTTAPRKPLRPARPTTAGRVR